MFKGQFATGAILGAGAAVNVSCGFIPAHVVVSNPRGAAETLIHWFGPALLRFDSGSEAILPGDVLVDATAGGKFTVLESVLLTGTFEGGDAAGYLRIMEESGTITNNNNLNRLAAQDRGASSNVATIDGSVIYTHTDTDSEVGTPAANFVFPYVGTTALAKGFTLSSGVMVSAENIFWTAWGQE